MALSVFTGNNGLFLLSVITVAVNIRTDSVASALAYFFPSLHP
jgi:hypothetical protein